MEKRGSGLSASLDEVERALAVIARFLVREGEPHPHATAGVLDDVHGGGTGFELARSLLGLSFVRHCCLLVWRVFTRRGSRVHRCRRRRDHREVRASRGRYRRLPPRCASRPSRNCSCNK